MQFGPEFDALIARFGSTPSSPIALAVSGGSDSFGLLALAHDWHKRTKRPLLVLTVNHNLRPEAAAEAEHVKQRAEALGHTHQTLDWQTPRASQNAARAARYRLLASAARAAGAACLLTGHTFDDVVETALIRRRRGIRDASIAGPALTAPLPVWPEGRSQTLIRPLIHTDRDSIRAQLRTAGWDWIEDPSNDTPVFERVRVRQFLTRHPQLRAVARAFVATLQTQRVDELQHISQALEEVLVDPDGLIDTGQAELSDTVLKILTRCASGSEQDPRGHAVRALRKNLRETGQRKTLGGAWFQRTDTGFRIGRDPAIQAHETKVDQSGTFDGRYFHAADGNLPVREERAFLVRATGPCGHHWREIISDRLQHIAACYQTPLINPVQR